MLVILMTLIVHNQMIAIYRDPDEQKFIEEQIAGGSTKNKLSFPSITESSSSKDKSEILALQAKGERTGRYSDSSQNQVLYKESVNLYVTITSQFTSEIKELNKIKDYTFHAFNCLQIYVLAVKCQCKMFFLFF